MVGRDEAARYHNFFSGVFVATSFSLYLGEK
jgi:hypothetical protein